METTIFLLFLYAAVEGDVGKHIFVNKYMKWLDAQTYCRQHHTDLSSVSSQDDLHRLLKATGAMSSEGWIGLQRDPNNITVWKWSGGGDITFENWNYGQPDNFDDNEHYGHIKSDGKWNDDDGRNTRPFYCIDINIVEESKSWEEALEHCRDHHTTLTSLVSETERLLAQKVIQRVNGTSRVWIGLRYLEDRWLWMNSNPLKYEAWSQDGDRDRLCPIRKRCGALNKHGLWDNWNCLDKLHFICI